MPGYRRVGVKMQARNDGGVEEVEADSIGGSFGVDAEWEEPFSRNTLPSARDPEVSGVSVRDSFGSSGIQSLGRPVRPSGRTRRDSREKASFVPIFAACIKFLCRSAPQFRCPIIPTTPTESRKFRRGFTKTQRLLDVALARSRGTTYRDTRFRRMRPVQAAECWGRVSPSSRLSKEGFHATSCKS